MEPDLSHDFVVEMLGAFALDAVDAAEAPMVRAHLDACPRCRDEVVQYQRTATMLANDGGAAPAGLWDLISARLEPPETLSRAFPPLDGTVSARPATGRGIRPRAARRAVGLMAVAAAAVIASLGVEVGHLDHRLNQLTAVSANPTMSAAAQSALLDPSSRRITLAGTGPAAPHRAELVVLGSGAGFLFNDGLPALASAKTYQLWAMVDGQPISVAVLGPHPGTAAFSLDAAAATRAFAVTVEPAGGSVAPTRPPVASTTV
jgi:Anti-sigma-K factor rskA/Putative zinc-finger